jgi:hypothetical protein
MWDPATVEGATEAGVEGRLLAYCRALDTGNLDDAARHLRRAMDAVAGEARMADAVRMEATYFEAACRHDVAAAQSWFDAIQTRMSPLLLGARNRAIAALQLADGRPADAGRRIEEGVAALRVFGFGGLAVFEQKLFARLDEWKNTLEVPQPVAALNPVPESPGCRVPH